MQNKLTKEFLVENYINKRIPIYKIAKEFHYAKITIIKYLRKFGIATDYSRFLVKEYLEEYYINKKLSSPEIAKLVGCDASTIRDYLRRYNIPIRDYSEAFKNGKTWLKTHSKENNHLWKGGITPLHILIRNLIENRVWIKSVFQRDNYTCQECYVKGGKLIAHHIKEFSVIFKEFLQEYSQFSPIEDKETLLRLAITYKPFWEISNGKTLCGKCHKLTYKTSNSNKKGEIKKWLQSKERLSGSTIKRVNKIALLKSGELLENQATGNQQPSLFKKEGSETRDENLHEPQTAIKIAEDIVRTANI